MRISLTSVYVDDRRVRGHVRKLIAIACPK
jgi:hypothetical protein